MSFETAFSLASLLAIAGWLSLLASPWVPIWSDRIAGLYVPVALSVGYLILVLIPSAQSGGFETLASVMELFSHEQAMLAGWVHYLAFDLIIGALICRSARTQGISFWFVLPCLPLVFLLGPVGFLAFLGVRMVHKATKRHPNPIGA